MQREVWLERLERALGKLVLEKQRFGRSGEISLWIETRNAPAAARILCDDPELELDWLENLSVMQLDSAFVLSWLARSSREQDRQVVLRASVVPASADALVEVPSVRGVWQMATPMEQELGALFGIAFGERPDTRGPAGDWSGYPLRKSFKTGATS